MTRGQSVRLFLAEAYASASAAYVIGAAKTMSLHISAAVENATTKDTVGDWIVNEVTSVSYDISASALLHSDETITSSVSAHGLASLIGVQRVGYPVKWDISNVTGANNRTKGATICSGRALITSINVNAPNRQNVTYDVRLQNDGEITVGG